mgnify:CR=1 FL=1|tara:strand:+ start:274 stop:648 length:375 start_codon:yes stop_codon:yes gene_type:complete
MGYTNYWYQRKSFTNEEWSKVLDEYDYIKDVLGGSVIFDESDVKQIMFNGNPENDQDHETFVLHKEAQTEPDYEGQDVSFNFCKTAEKPYDIAVWHLLSFCHTHTNAIWRISRDRPTLVSVKDE